MIKRIKFLGVPVRVQERALAFYTGKLGFQVFTDRPFNDAQRWIELSIPGAETRLVLLTPDGQEDRIGSFLNTAWEVDNVQQTYEHLSAAGAEFKGPPEKQPWGSFPIMKDSEGNSICLLAR